MARKIASTGHVKVTQTNGTHNKNEIDLLEDLKCCHVKARYLWIFVFIKTECSFCYSLEKC